MICHLSNDHSHCHPLYLYIGEYFGILLCCDLQADIDCRISSLPDGNTEPVLDRLSSDDHIPNIGDKQIMPPPEQTERDVAESATEYEPHLDEALWTGVDAAKSAHEQKGSDEDLPEKKSAKLTAMVNLNHGASTGATRVFVTIAKNGDTRFELTQDNGSEY